MNEEIIKLIEEKILREQMSLRESIRYIIQLKGGKDEDENNISNN